MLPVPTDSVNESIRLRLLKVLRLAREGVGGERENAEVLLEKLLRKHSMSLSDLEEGSDMARRAVWIAAADADERLVLSQLALKLFGADRKLWGRAGETNLCIEVSPAEEAALLLGWEVYRDAFREARQSLVIGFCFKHGLYVTEGDSAPDSSPEGRARAARAMAMADALPVVDSPHPRLGRG